MFSQTDAALTVVAWALSLRSMQHGSSAGSGNTIPEKNTALGVAGFPQYPQEGFLAHEAALYKEMVDARLATAKLLAVANQSS